MSTEKIRKRKKISSREGKRKTSSERMRFYTGASDEARTRYLHLGKVALYQMSYTRIWCPGPDSNQRHADFQSAALPTELQGHKKALLTTVVGTTGLEPVTLCL